MKPNHLKTNPTNTFKVPKIEVRKKFTDYEIVKARLDYFFLGFITALVIFYFFGYVAQ